jgi:hypothetical protein
MARRYAPALTKQAFKQVRPHGQYEDYLRFLKRNRPGWDPSRPMVAQRVGPPTRGAIPTYESLLRGLSFETPAQIEARARRMANMNFSQGRSLLQENYRMAQEDAARKMQLLAGAGRAAAAMNAGLIGQVGGQYQAGADQLSALASAGAAQMSGATDAAVAGGNAALSNVGMPGVTVGGPVGAPGIAGPTQAGVEQYYGGTLPAGAMQNAGGFAQAGAAGQIAAQNLRATQEAQMGYAGSTFEAGRERAQGLRELMRGRGSLMSEYLTKLQDAQRQQVALAQSLLGSRTQKVATAADIAATKAGVEQRWEELGISRDTYETNKKQIEASMARAEEEADRLGREVDEARSIALKYYVDKQGRPILKNGKRIPVPAAITEKEEGTPVRQKMAAAARDWIYADAQRRGGGTLQQLKNYLLSQYPGNPKLADQIARSLWTQKKGGGGALGSQPGKP